MNLKVRLSVMNFMEFAVWGAYLTCMGNYLGIAGLGDKISWFYAIQGIVSIFMPTLMGIVADKYIQPQRLLGLCHLVAGGFMIGCWWLGEQAGFGNELADKSLFIALYTLSVAFYMPTIALTNTAAFTILKNNGMDTVKDFPPIRVLGTIGFIATMWFVNCAYIDDSGFGFTFGQSAHMFQYTYLQFLVSGLLSLVLFAYCLTLPECKLEKKQGKVSLAETLGLNAFKLFKRRQMALFFIFSALLGMCLQVTNGFAGPFLTSFKPAEIMKVTGISKSKYYRLKKDRDFQKILTERRTELVKSAVMKMESYLTEDVEILQSIIRKEDTSDQVKINGINLLMSQLNTWKQTTEILDRLQALEDAQTKNEPV